MSHNNPVRPQVIFVRGVWGGYRRSANGSLRPPTILHNDAYPRHHMSKLALRPPLSPQALSSRDDSPRAAAPRQCLRRRPRLSRRPCPVVAAAGCRRSRFRWRTAPPTWGRGQRRQPGWAISLRIERKRRPHCLQTIASVGLRTSDRIDKPPRGTCPPQRLCKALPLT